MARPKSDTVDYFPHMADASGGDTLTVLEERFGNDGYAFWFKLLERLAAADGHYLDCRNPIKWKTICAKAHVDEATGEAIMVLLREMEAIDKGLWDLRIIWCQKLVNNFSDVYRDRRRSSPEKPSFPPENRGFTPEKPSFPPSNIPPLHPPLNKSKLNKSKLNNNYPPIIPPPSKKSLSLLSDRDRGVVKDVFKIWADEFDTELTPHITGLLRGAIESYGEDTVCFALNEAVERNKKSWKYVQGILENIKTEEHNEDVPVETIDEYEPDPAAVKLWEQALKEVRTRVNKTNFEVWLAPVKAVSCTDEVLVLACPSRFSAEYLRKHQADVIESALSGLKKGIRPTFKVNGSKTALAPGKKESKAGRHVREV